MKFNYKAAALSPVIMMLLSSASSEQIESSSHSHSHMKNRHKHKMQQKDVSDFAKHKREVLAELSKPGNPLTTEGETTH